VRGRGWPTVRPYGGGGPRELPATYGVAVNTTSGLEYATLLEANAVQLFDRNMTTIPVGTMPMGIAVNSNTNRVYVANSGSQNVSVVDGDTKAVIAGNTATATLKS
jgi:DNA-binding beta-propeller fold protein YncE